MYRSVFMFLVREMNSWPLMLILWYEGRRREAPPPLLPSQWHTALPPIDRKTRRVAVRARHPGRGTFYAVLPVGGVKASIPRPLSSLLPSFLFGPAMAPPRWGVWAAPLLLAAFPLWILS